MKKLQKYTNVFEIYWKQFSKGKKIEKMNSHYGKKIKNVNKKVSKKERKTKKLILDVETKNWNNLY